MNAVTHSVTETAAISAPTVVPALATAVATPTNTRSWADRLIRWLDLLSLSWFIPVVEIIRGHRRAWQARQLARMLLLPAGAITLSLIAWSMVASATAGSAGGLVIPGPAVVWERGMEQVREWQDERAKRAQHQHKKDQELAAIIAEETAKTKVAVTAAQRAEFAAQVESFMPYPSKTIFVDYIMRSLGTVIFGVALAVIGGVLIGILIGFSSHAFEAVNPIIQILKPVSPLAWFPVVYIVVNKTMANVPPDALINKPFVMSAVVVALCALWPTMLNTANGVANVEKDYRNVARVLRMGWIATVWRIILPASVPAIFTGMRLSMGIGWMVLIATEMMAVSNGLGMYVSNWYQSSNDTALSYLLMAVIVIGGIGFLLDRLMITGQKLVSHGNTAAIR